MSVSRSIGPPAQPDDWREVDENTDYGVRETRQLLIGFIGGEPGQQLRDQFA